MPIKFRCEHCHQLLGISQAKAGEQVDCPTCGRAVQVPSLDGSSGSEPKPSWNVKDQSLLNALESLASLNSGSESSVETSAPSDQQEDVSSPPPVVSPEPIELPPLEKPVALAEPEHLQNPEPPEPETIEPVQAKEITASAAYAEPTSIAPAKTSFPLPQESPNASGKAGVPVSAVVILILMSFVAGYGVGGLNGISTEEIVDSVSEVTEQSETVSVPQMDSPVTQSENEALRQAIEGRITYRTAEGSTQADEGAVVVLLPVYRKSSGKLPITGFRPADSNEDREIARAAVRALGGDLTVVDADGDYTARLPQAGEYHLLVLSRHVARNEEGSIESTEIATLGEYFDRPRQLLGQLKFRMGTVNYRGENKEIWDHAFEAG